MPASSRSRTRGSKSRKTARTTADLRLSLIPAPAGLEGCGSAFGQIGAAVAKGGELTRT
jgi:hypothetical protein